MSVAIVMVDTRPPSISQLARANVSLKDISATALAYYLNVEWACANANHRLFYYELGEFGCAHPTWGRRHPSYCKLAAVSDVLTTNHDAEWVVFLDSDAMIRWPHRTTSVYNDDHGSRGCD